MRRRIELFGFGVQIGMDVGRSRLATPMSSDEQTEGDVVVRDALIGTCEEFKTRQLCNR